MLCALIMAGGKGTRFWPLSTEEKPKQFLKLIGEETMIQMTVNRIKPIIPIDRIFVCTGETYVDLVKEQLPQLPERNIIIEPEGRNTTPCIALSAIIIEKYYNNCNMVVLPSDHLINNENEFRDIILDGDEYLKINTNAIITLGMKPTRAETGYGYIKFTDKKKNITSREVLKVESFVEKPNKEKAEKYLAEGKYLWNGGMFLWSTKNIINQIKVHSPNTYEALKEVSEVDESKIQQVINDRYCNTEAISIDYAVLEKSKDIFVIPSDIGWDDIGSWKAIERYRETDSFGNIKNYKSTTIESKNNMVINNKKKVVMIGVEDILTIEAEDVIYVVNKNRMENLKDFKVMVE